MCSSKVADPLGLTKTKIGDPLGLTKTKLGDPLKILPQNREEKPATPAPVSRNTGLVYTGSQP